MRTHKPVSVSLPPDLFAAAEQRAKELGFKRATYIQQLILADLKSRESEPVKKAEPVKQKALPLKQKAKPAAKRKGTKEV